MIKKLSRLLALTALGLLFACNKQPNITVSTTSLRATVSVETLGEYGTTVRKAALKERGNGRVVWEIEIRSGLPQLHRLTFEVGPNSVALAKPQGGDYSVAIPEGASIFSISPNTDYEIEIWRDLSAKPATAFFRLSGK